MKPRYLVEDIEDEQTEFHVYEDSKTGKRYTFDGTRLKPLSDFEYELMKEDAEREKQIEREYEEAKKKGLNIHKETPEEKAKRIQEIQDILNDEQKKKDYVLEVGSKVKRPKPSKYTKERVKEAPKAKSIKLFEVSLKKFIKKQVGSKKEYSYKKMNKKYSGSNIIKPGIKKHSEDKVPLLVAYFDRSGSWSPSDTAIAEKVIDSLSNYVRQGKLKIEIKYFDTAVYDHDRGGGGTRGTPIVKDIMDIAPDNVVVMTDGDIKDINISVTVPGGVWLIFKQTRFWRDYPESDWVDQNVIDHIKGRKLTEIFKIPYGEDMK